MRVIDATTAANYLRDKRRVPPGARVFVRELAGGVSNVVLRVDVEGEPPFVLKQSRERLRVPQEWYSRLERIWTERDTLALLGQIIPGEVPSLLFDEPDDYLLAMECAPDDAVVWKSLLMAGETDAAIASRVGSALGAIHAETSGRDLGPRLNDTSLFDELRVDPYYRQVARVHADLAPAIGRLIDTMTNITPTALTLGDFSPKNILVSAGRPILLDFEAAHRGDPAFDLGFVASHLLLKAFRAGPRAADYHALLRALWNAYRERACPPAELEPRSAWHAAACTLARLDGKSRVDYLDDLDVDAVRSFACEAVAEPAGGWEELIGWAAKVRAGG